MARQIAEKREARARAAANAKRRARRTLEDFMASMEKGESQELNLILKGDVSGSVEALEDALSQIDVGEDVGIRVIDRGVGAITETNVDLAAASDAIITICASGLARIAAYCDSTITLSSPKVVSSDFLSRSVIAALPTA